MSSSMKSDFNSNDGFTRAPEQLNFAAAPSEDEADYQNGGFLKKGKQDPMSHRIIEKRRRDRMNNCLADLSRLIPPEYLKKGRGRVEKTEIIEMAIRHIKYLQDRANAPDKPAGGGDAMDHFKAGFQEAVAEAVRFLVEVQGLGPADGLCVQLASHMQRHCDRMTKVEPPPPQDTSQSHFSSENTSSSGSSNNFVGKPGVIARVAPPPEVARYPESYEPAAPEQAYPMDCDRGETSTAVVSEDTETPASDEPLQLDVRHKGEPTLRTIRKPDFPDDFLQSYKFKNSIERRFSRSQDNEVHDMSIRAIGMVPHAHAHNKLYSHKRRRPPAKPVTSTSTSNSGSTEEAQDTSPQETSSESPHHHYEKPTPTAPSQFVPVFALNSLGKYYVPLSVEYSCLSRYLGPYDVLDARAATLAAPLHPVTIHVNFQPCMNYHVKREREPNREWRAM
ncbi:transcription factor cwo isoform X2 [Plutella xylostella]|uniref:transcription factor cwo isoform X2 n=1 Tax=Plutella xylostella TaxID=51655 RepID=UPI0018D09FE0|nr:transcription factor cwo isoform X2 [Plutella xylostella]